MSEVDYKPLPPKEAIKFLKNKGYALGFDWQDVWKEEHTIAFTVAKATSVDILSDIKQALETSLAEGQTFANFKSNLKPLLAQKGWWGKKELIDPLDGEAKEVQLGSTRRLKTIYDTNIRMAHSAGKWERLQQTKKTRPYLAYHAVIDERTRVSHKQWDKLVLPIDDSFWDTHYPPNGWHCRCKVSSYSKADLERYGYEISQSPEISYKDYVNTRTGETMKVPQGISPGFDYNVGKARFKAYTPPPKGGLPSTFQNRLAELPPIPKASKPPAGAILPDNLTNEAYIKSFLGEFGADINKPAIYNDVMDEPLLINEALFKSNDGSIKLHKGHRGKYMRLLALSLKEPDEVWLSWAKTHSGSYVLKRRYIKIWDMPNGSHALSVFDKESDGWVGATTFAPYSDRNVEVRDKYINKYRDGLLMYKR